MEHFTVYMKRPVLSPSPPPVDALINDAAVLVDLKETPSTSFLLLLTIERTTTDKVHACRLFLQSLPVHDQWTADRMHFIRILAFPLYCCWQWGQQWIIPYYYRKVPKYSNNFTGATLYKHNFRQEEGHSDFVLQIKINTTRDLINLLGEE